MFLNQPIYVRLNRDLGVIRAGLIVEFPRHFALSLLRRRGLATVVGDSLVIPDAVISEDELRQTEIDIDPVFIAAGRIADVELR